MSYQPIAQRFDLTPIQASFVRHYCNGEHETAAARKAGYSADCAQEMGVTLLRKPHVLAAIQFESRRRTVTAAPLAIGVIEKILKDDALPAKVRLDAAKTVLDRVGIIAPRAVAPAKGEERALHERSAEELRDLAARLETELASRAMPVKTPDSTPTPAEYADLIE